MNIAINARVLNERTGGPARYTLNVIRELSKIDHDNQYVLILYDDYNFDFRLPSNFKIKLLKFKSRVFLDYIYIPLFSYLYKTDIFIFPKNTYSPFVKGKKIPVYHDIIYFENMGFREFNYFDNLHHTFMIPLAARFSWRDLTVSKFTGSRMVSLLHTRKEKLRIVHEGVEEKFRVISNRKILKSLIEKYCLKLPFYFYSGSLSPRKNMINVIKAFNEIKDQLPHQLYFTGGDSWLDSEVFRLIKDNKLEYRIIKLGFVPDEDLIGLYNLADCYLYPSLYEGFGLPILEAQSCGCPVITSSVASCPEVAGKGALYVDPYDIGSIAHAMRLISNDKALRKKLIQAGLQNSKQYTWEKTARGIHEIFYEK